jgi:hypothetical protein
MGVLVVSDLPVRSWILLVFVLAGTAATGLAQTEAASAQNRTSATYRVEYAGTCLPDVTPLATRPISKKRFTGAIGLMPPNSGMRWVELPPGAAGIEVFRFDGRKVWEYRRSGVSGAERGAMPPALGRGMLWLRMGAPGERAEIR